MHTCTCSVRWLFVWTPGKLSRWAEKLYKKMTKADRCKVHERALRMQKVMTTQTVSKAGKAQVRLAGNKLNRCSVSVMQVLYCE